MDPEGVKEGEREGQDMRTFPAAVLLAIAVACTTCCCAAISSYRAYESDMFQGRLLLERGEYASARALFLKAATQQDGAEPYAFALTASYRMNDMEAAGRSLAEAERFEAQGFLDLRIAGYKALVLLRENRKAEGMEALRDYIRIYSARHPLTTIEAVKEMEKKGDVNLQTLGVLIDEQVDNYEAEIAQFIGTGTGFYDQRDD